MYHFVPVFGYSTPLIFSTDNVTGNILQKNQWNALPIIQRDKLRRFERTVRKEHPVVGQNAHLVPVNVCPSAYEGRAVKRFEFKKFGSVNYSCDDFSRIIRF